MEIKRGIAEGNEAGSRVASATPFYDKAGRKERQCTNSRQKKNTTH